MTNTKKPTPAKDAKLDHEGPKGTASGTDYDRENYGAGKYFGRDYQKTNKTAKDGE